MLESYFQSYKYIFPSVFSLTKALDKVVNDVFSERTLHISNPLHSPYKDASIVYYLHNYTIGCLAHFLFAESLYSF